MFLVPNPTAWPALPERVGGRERESKEKSIVQLKQPWLCIFWAGGETDGEDLCERGSLTPVATVPAGAKGRRFCKMNKLLYYLGDKLFDYIGGTDHPKTHHWMLKAKSRAIGLPSLYSP